VRRALVVLAASVPVAACQILAGIDVVSFGRTPDAAEESADGVTPEDGRTGDARDGELDAGPVPLSCEGLPRTCGANGDDDCCAADLVPAGTFSRSYDGVFYTEAGALASVSEFRLDRYEVTVGRLRKFVEAYPGSGPSPKVGTNPSNAADPGWQPIWNAELPKSEAELRTSLACVGTTWTETPSRNETKPINCVDWYVAFAFCAWDSGRLPSEAEWNYVAAGGSEHRVYPWSDPADATVIDESYAVYTAAAAPPGIQLVGSKPKGAGRWGQLDLAGNVAEWTLDWFHGAYDMPCSDCAKTDGGASRVYRGGSFFDDQGWVRVAKRSSIAPTKGADTRGVRCARAPVP